MRFPNGQYGPQPYGQRYNPYGGGVPAGGMPMGFPSSNQAEGMSFNMGASSLAGAIPMNFGGSTAAVIDNLNITLAKASALGAVTAEDYAAGLAQSDAIRAARGEAPRGVSPTAQQNQTSAAVPPEKKGIEKFMENPLVQAGLTLGGDYLKKKQEEAQAKQKKEDDALVKAKADKEKAEEDARTLAAEERAHQRALELAKVKGTDAT